VAVQTRLTSGEEKTLRRGAEIMNQLADSDA
jgi:hypothetical protein